MGRTDSEGSSDREPINPRRSSDFGSINETSNRQPKQEVMAQNKYEIWGMPLIAEFVGSLLFAFLHSMSAGTSPGTAASAVTDGIFVTIMVITIGHISGAHVNSAVTVGVTLSGGLPWTMFPLYIIVQLLGSMGGAGLALAVKGTATGAFGLATADISVGQGLLCEIMISTLLIFAVLMSAVDQGSPIAAFAIGFSIMIGIFAGAEISGACMNPSLSFGPAVVSGRWTDYWIYWVGPIIGALIAVFLHRLGLGNREKRLFLKENGEADDATAMKSHTDGGESNTGYQGDPENSRM